MRTLSRIKRALGLLALATIESTINSNDACAYPNFIGHGYTSCITCHFHPLGNGPLNDYGRAVSASAISAKPFFTSKRTTDEDLANGSGFLGNPERLPVWFRSSVGIRGMLLYSGLESQSKRRFIPMQADANGVIKLWRDKVILSGTMGYAPVPQNTPSNRRASVAKLISREHYLGVRPIRSFGIYAGYMDPSFGIRVAEHTAYIRAKQLYGMNDQTHGVLLHWVSSRWEIGFHSIVGSLFQKAGVRQKGISTVVEFEPKKKLRLGVSGMVTRSSFRTRQLAALHTRAGLGEGSAVLAQFGLDNERPSSESAKLGGVGLVQTTTQLTRGLNFLFTFEYYTEQFFRSASRLYRAGPSLQYFPMQRLELRTDLLSSRVMGQSNVDDDTNQLLLQLHLYL